MIVNRLRQNYHAVIKDDDTREEFLGGISLLSFITTVFFAYYLNCGNLMTTLGIAVVPLFVYQSIKKSLTG